MGICIINQYFLFINQLNIENNETGKKFKIEKMDGIPFMEERERLQKAMMEIFQKEVQTLDPELQSILIDDIVTALYNRLNIMKKIQDSKEMQLCTNNSLVLKPMHVLDPDTLQSMDENNKRWVKHWREAVSKLVSKK